MLCRNYALFWTLFCENIHYFQILYIIFLNIRHYWCNFGRHYLSNFQITGLWNDDCYENGTVLQISLKWGTWEPGSQALLVLPGTFSEKNTKLAPLNRPLELPGTFNGKCFKLIKCACWTFQKCLAECGRYENNKCMCLLAYSICDADHVPDD